jgi:hypothetical protein
MLTHTLIGRSAARASASLALAGALAVGAAGAAYAGGPLLWANWDDIGERWTVCARDLAVRTTPGGEPIGYLYGPNETFRIADPGRAEFGGEWVRGHAFGNVNKDGYVQNGWFCHNNGG